MNPDNERNQKVMKIQQHYFAVLKQALPVFSGSLGDNNVNWLLELDILQRLLDGETGFTNGLSPK